jgi:predicted PurR-regulated permease PerM
MNRSSSVGPASDREKVIMMISSPWRLSLRSWLALLALGLTLWFTIAHASTLFEIGWVLFGALLLSLAIRPLADALARWHVPRGLAVLGVYALLVALLALVSELLIPVVRSEVAHLRHSGPDLLKKALSTLSSVPVLGQWLPPSQGLAESLAQRVDALLRPLIDALTGVGGLALDVLGVLILTYFFTADAEIVAGLLGRWVPAPHQARVRGMLDRLRHRLAHWAWAQAALAVYLGLAYSLGLTILGVPFALTIGLVGGVLEIVPYLGGITALLLAVLSALTVHPLLALWVILIHIIIVEVEGHLLAPALFGRAVGLHPAVILVALLVGIKSGGIVGVLFAVPVAVVLLTVLDEVYAGPRLPDTTSAGPEPEQVQAPTDSSQP